MQLTILGTSCMVPTKDRNTAGYFLEYKNEGILIDCGEGTQRQMKQCGIKLSKITRIIITHWHGDHVLGLGGLIQSIMALDHADTLHIYGPKGTKKYFDHLTKSLAFELRIPLDLHEIDEGKVFENEDLLIETLPVKHRVTCLAYSITEKDTRKMDNKKLTKYQLAGPKVGQLQRGETVTHDGQKITPDMVSTIIKGRKFAHVTDTLLVDNCFTIAKDADVLLCECVYDESLADKAKEYFHLTAKEAATLASKSGCKKLVTTHFSARYKDTSLLEEEAREIFDNVISGKDFMKINI